MSTPAPTMLNTWTIRWTVELKHKRAVSCKCRGDLLVVISHQEIMSVFYNIFVGSEHMMDVVPFICS